MISSLSRVQSISTHARPHPSLVWESSVATLGYGISGMSYSGHGNPSEVISTASMGICSATVLILSVAGLAGHGLRGAVDLHIAAPLAVAVLLGGLAGAHIAETRLSAVTLKRLFAIIVLVAAVRAAVSAFS